MSATLTRAPRRMEKKTRLAVSAIFARVTVGAGENVEVVDEEDVMRCRSSDAAVAGVEAADWPGGCSWLFTPVHNASCLWLDERLNVR